MRVYLLVILVLCCRVSFSEQALDDKNIFTHPFYAGFMGGLGSTTWQGLVPSEENQNAAISVSTPISVKEGGWVWGALAGYELTPFFAIEANYLRFSDATVNFDQDSLYAFDHEGLTSLSTQTQTAAIFAKIMLVIPKTSIRLYSGAGVATVWRKDEINNDYRISPTFAVGGNINFSERIMGEIGTNYIAGYGESEINPVKDYIPFLYSFYIKLALRFG